MVEKFDTDRLQQLGQAYDAVIIAKLNRPGGPEHQDAMQKLTEIVAKDPAALNALTKQLAEK